ncbi:DMSO/TMAO reductase YedYZ molybdopterin-dependent catalytic subunit [Pseudorhodoferax soli]|uniref:DMSO/TMAO reductase YedYZ molybdopterin-dependent catalytic subunit n=2 Tax=Pseudorhodoferax soli TaxID=545864 RepID=A0A368X7Q2_9BURK|nr:DMSO/TMAO reductase YedYZ molybdopterin-dependent catalytic subunit [Pseudorhodoferax soli]
MAAGVSAAGSAAFAANPATPVQTPGAGAKPLPTAVQWKDASSLIVHSSTTVELKRGSFGSSGITPTDRLYLRNNLPTPDASIMAEPEAWEVSVEGVRKPRTLDVRTLRTLGVETVAMVMQCSGNGRAFFPSKPSGTPWQVGAAGCVLWSGVPVRAVVEALGGLADGVIFMTGTGGEKLPEGLDPKSIVVERSVPIAAMGDALLAWELNGSPIPLAHGGPLRLIVPGYTGVNSIKYIRRLAFSTRESDAHIMSHGYRISPPGAKGDPTQPSVQEMSVKSWITSPGADAGQVRSGRTQIQGVAFGGLHAVSKVEVSTDGGENWQVARLVGPDLGKYAWRQFALSANLPTGTHTLVCRATDQAGNVQPRERMENAGGYNNNSWADHGLKVVIA